MVFTIVVFSGYRSSDEIAGAYGRFISTFKSNLHTVFHNGYINLHSHQERWRVPFFPHPLQLLLHVDFSMMSILTGVISNCSFDLHFSNNEQC